MKFLVKKRVSWEDGSRQTSLFDINAVDQITAVEIKAAARPRLAANESITEIVKVEGVELTDPSVKIDLASTVEYYATVTKKSNPS